MVIDMKAIREEIFITLWVIVIIYNIAFYSDKSIGWIIISIICIVVNTYLMIHNKKGGVE
jgi:hypothetical protein